MAKLIDTLSLGKNTLLYLTSSAKSLIGGSMDVSDNIDGAISLLTSPTYSAIYGTLNNINNSNTNNQTIGVDILLPTDGNQEKTGSMEYTAWDPRLSRIDSFLARDGVDDSQKSPLIIPFASTTAAGAFYDMVFTTEKIVVDIVKNGAKQDKSNPTNTLTTEVVSNGQEGDKNDYTPSSKIYAGDPDELALIKNSNDSYGVASIVNPYTLTKLCGALTVSGDKDNSTILSIDNRLYDVRDKRRFYDLSIDKNDDYLSISNPTTTNIITYANKDPWGRTPYYFLDFVFCKYWNIIPNNRLITLRKYHAPVYDNLQFSSMLNKNQTINQEVVFAPIATVLSYFGDETGNDIKNILGFTTGTNWKDIKSEIHQVGGLAGSDPHGVIDDMFTNGSGFPTGKWPVLSSIIDKTNMLTGKYFSYGKFVGLLSPNGYNIKADLGYFDKVNKSNMDPSEQLYSNKIKGPVNRIDSTKARDAGIKFELRFTLVCEYVARPIGGVNTKAAMLDILSNCLEIGSVEAMFWGGGYRFMIDPNLYPFKNNAFKNQIMDDLYAGRIFGKDGALAHTVEGIKSFADVDGNGNFSWDSVLLGIKNVMGETLGALGGIINSVTNSLFGDAFNKLGEMVSDPSTIQNGNNKGKALTSNINDMWKTLVTKAAVIPTVENMKALLTGEPVGNWHLTVGNPLNPMLVIGNLICTSMKIEFGDELGPDDFPLNLKVTYDLEHAMARDKASIQSMFNRGNGKIYQLPDFIRASSDYESKVDNYTGPAKNGNNGWYTPKYMNATAMLNESGYSGGYKTYKMALPKQLAMNAHTDNMFISKFTPVDVDAAISNIKSGTHTFFDAAQGSRAWIRGAAITRKLMN